VPLADPSTTAAVPDALLWSAAALGVPTELTRRRFLRAARVRPEYAVPRGSRDVIELVLLGAELQTRREQVSRVLTLATRVLAG
jgi:hypothetical protein